ncbi:Alpha/beta hydrolase fold [Trema orientale]|uniref:Alpha/beta hydrolase fold n=1 Tax=Trema orientale TaxID=63057 RepID=A0A2P5AEY5_TREOI|nr:Alpha/beta hydrolase fold [Trema orientale]
MSDSDTEPDVVPPKPWTDADLAGDAGEPYVGVSARMSSGEAIAAVRSETMRDHAMEFLKGVAEMSVEFGKGCRDIVKQSLANRDSFLVRKFGKESYVRRRIGGACEKVRRRLRFFNEYLPEDKDPVHSWSVIFLVAVLAFAVLNFTMEHSSSTVPTPEPEIKKVYLHPPSADRVVLPDGRYMAYREQGVPADRARFSVIAPHAFLSSRLAGIPGLKASLLEEFGVRLLTYDLPGFGESDPHPERSLESSAADMSLLADAIGVKGKFWVVGYSTGSIHAWAALRYIPERLAGAAMFAPMVNPYDPIMSREERRRTWGKWTRRKKFMYFLARRFPRFLAYFYHRSFLSGKHGQIDKWLSMSLAKRDTALIEDPIYEEFWQRDVEESIRQGNVQPFIEEATMQVSNWGFSLAELKLHKKLRGKGMLNWLKSMLSEAQEEYLGFLGPIHIWQGMDDRVVPPSVTDFVHRIIPGAAVHKLPYEGHFTYVYFCDECHRQIFTTLFGIPQGPLNNTVEINPSPLKSEAEPTDEITPGDSATDEL